MHLDANSARGQAPTVADWPIGKNLRMAIDRVAWIATVLVALITALLLLLSGYTGYAGLGLAVAIAAAINLI